MVCHSAKEQAAATFKSTFGYHPILAFLDNSGEFLAGLLRPGNAGANTAADHISVLDAALAQIPDAYRHGVPVLVRADGAGCSKAFLAHVRGRRAQGVRTEFTVGWAVTDREREAISRLPAGAWTDAIDADGRPRESGPVAELTGLLPAGTFADYPAGTRVLVRRTPAPRRPTGRLRTPRRLALPMLRHRHHSRATGLPRRPPPRPRPGRGPHPHRHGHRPGPLPQQDVRHQRRLADHRHARRRPARLDPDDPPARSSDPDPSRAKDTALPAVARRRPPAPGRPRPALALGGRSGRRLRPLRCPSPASPLNPHHRPRRPEQENPATPGQATRHDLTPTNPATRSTAGSAIDP